MEIHRQEKLFIGGEWVAPIDGAVVESIDPSTGKVWATAAFGGRADIDRAVNAAQDALRGPWRRFSPLERANLLRRFALAYQAHALELAELEARDNGLPIRDARAAVANHVNWYNYFAGLAEQLDGRHVPVHADMHVYTTRVPVGVVGGIIPWNAPLLIMTWKLAPVLATGCTLIIKAAEQTPITAYAIARIAEEVGIPPGVINVVPGWGPVAGAALSEHPRVNKISFTGEHRTAQIIMQSAAVNLKRLSFECGGKAPHIIFEDARIDQALNAATHSAFTGCGQSCALGSRLLVQRGIYAEVVAELGRRAQKIRVGAALDTATQMGPHSHAEQLEKTLSYFDIGRQEGARLVAGGKRLTGANFGDGYFVEPTVFADVESSMRIAQEEIFGPVVAVMPFDDEEEALALANNTEYGLVAGLWTQNVGRAHRIASRIDAGTVWVNTYRFLRWNLPYGGMKISGLGRENGPEVLEHFTETKSTIVHLTGDYADAYA